MKKTVIIVTAIFVLIFLFAGCSESPELATVSVAAVKSGGDLSTLVWHGNIEALRSLDVSPNVSGKVESIHVSEGESVKAGDILYILDSADVRLQLKQAEASLKAAKTAAENAAAANDADTLVLPARIALGDAQDNYNRMQALFEAAMISESDLNIARSRVETAEAQLAAAQINQRSTYENTRAGLDTAGVAVEIAAKRLADCTITAPAGGLVTKVNVEPGAYVSPQAPVLTIADDSGLQVKIQVLETDIIEISQGLAMDILIQPTGQTYAGVVETIAPVADTRAGVFEVSVLLHQTTDMPRLGLTADVRVNGARAADTVYAPESGVVTENGISSVFVVENNIVSRRQVEITGEKAPYLEVKGLRAGEEVVVGSSSPLSEGERVNVINQGLSN